ncbi:hypothetical protein JL722_9328 [Aureococcus anophagefferens]|nr:hypothetical protein JL722_9328 [Aureococcus anophagefferens]
MGCCLSKREDRNDYDLLTSDDIVGDVDGGLLSEQLQEFGFFRRATTMFRGRKSTVVGRRPTVARKTRYSIFARKPRVVVAPRRDDDAAARRRSGRSRDTGRAAEAAVEDAAARLRRAEAAARVAFAERWVVGVRVALRDQWIARAEASHLRDQYAMDARTAARFVKQGHRHGKESMLQASVKKTRTLATRAGARTPPAIEKRELAQVPRRLAVRPKSAKRRKGVQMKSKNWDRRSEGAERKKATARRGATTPAKPPTLREKLGLAPPKKRPWDDGHHVAPEADPAQPAAYRTLREKRAVAETDDASSYLDESLVKPSLARRRARSPEPKATKKLRGALGIHDAWDESFAYKTFPRPKLPDVAARRGLDPEPVRPGKGAFKPYGTLSKERSDHFRSFQERPCRKKAMREYAKLAVARRRGDEQRRSRDAARRPRDVAPVLAELDYDRARRPLRDDGRLRGRHARGSTVGPRGRASRSPSPTRRRRRATRGGRRRTSGPGASPRRLYVGRRRREAPIRRAAAAVDGGREPRVRGLAAAARDAEPAVGRGASAAAPVRGDLRHDARRGGARAKRPESAPKRAMKDQLQDPEMPSKCKLQRPKSATGVAGMDVGPVVFERKARALLKKI